ncbi:hypothetical protein AN619_29020 [Thermotalea metallivorans]|uniref:Uncharacterized protein n=2 Tax=Thermotalea metallivorans TaxID=520762 RepID=A0A140KZP3_9FIRM|nr:hypothetical protein AN619_29020 [Thermotalea metallivorans]
MIGDLIKQSKDGRDSVYAGLRELKDNGYMERNPVKDKNGKIVYWESVVYETSIETEETESPLTENPEMDNPLTDFPYLENPDLEKPDLENPTLLINEYNNNNLNQLSHKVDVR